MSVPCHQPYARVVITGELKCLSDVHIGSGNTIELTAGKQGKPSAAGEAPTINELVLDHCGRPVIPGASLRGYLRANMDRSDAHSTLFGQAKGRATAGHTECAGALRVYDSVLAGDFSQEAHLRHRTAIEPITRTARHHHLFTDNLVPGGSRFSVGMVLDNVDKATVETLLQALANLHPDNPSAHLGQGKSHGRGHMQWSLSSVKALTHDSFIQWLLADIAKAEPTKLASAAWTSFNAAQYIEGQDNAQWETLALRYTFDTPVLINDPQIVSGKKGDSDLRFMRRGSDMLIPGASIKGVFRAQARRILMTLCSDQSRVDRLIGQLFGSTTVAGVVRFYDICVASGAYADHQQTLIAIDRFTGGVKDGALLNIEAAAPQQSVQAKVAIKPLQPWQQSLWHFVLRDAMEGDLSLGWGAARGFGAFRLAVRHDQSYYQRWSALCKALGIETLQANYRALQQTIADNGR